MGAWGVGSFENDDALGWVDELVEAADLSPVEEAVATVDEIGEGYLEAPEASVAIAAAEVVAAVRGFPGPDLPDAVRAWISEQGPLEVSAGLADSARRAVARVRAHSELQELWDESDDAEAWSEAVASVRARLGP
jgi:uncharacterized protein DUF4259